MRHTPKKSLGQNFLRDPLVLEKIAEGIAPQPHDRILEIGPGQGALTETLLKYVPHLHAIELDRDLLEPLQKQFGKQLTLMHGDALRAPFPEGPLRVVGNLPYQISTPLLFRCIEKNRICWTCTLCFKKKW